jgi:hypothetical protein
VALIAKTLKDGLLDVFKGYPKTPQAGAQRLAKAYDTYARAVTASSASSVGGAATPNFTGTEVKRLEALLLSVLVSPKTAMPLKLANAWANGVVSYWFGPPLTFVGVCSIPPVPPIGFMGLPQVGVILQTTAVIPAVVPTLTALFSNLANTAEVTATVMATTLDSATKTITFTMAPPPLSPGFLV